MLKAIIIDDQAEAIEDLHYLITKNELPVEILATATSGTEGLVAILKHKPQIVFLDIVMPGMSGFEMLELIPNIDFLLIITTSFDTYAIQAIRSSALDFLLKPIKLSELKEAINRSVEINQLPSKSQINLLENTLKEPNQPIRRIAVNVANEIELINLDEVLYFESDGNYTTIHLIKEKSLLVIKQIGKLHELIESANFYRTHNSYLVNLNFIQKFVKSDGGYIVLTNGKSIPVARNRKVGLVEKLANTP